MARFAIHTLVFYGLETLDRMIRNTGVFVERIYLSYSPVPWNSYNKGARAKYSSEINKSLVEQLPFREKIIWLEGIWSTEEDQRNHSLERAKADGMDYLIIQDADEFYQRGDFKANLTAIALNPNHAFYKCPWTVFWKTLAYVILVREHEGKKGATITACPNFAVNVNYPGIRFSNRRLVNKLDDSFMLPGLCLHLAWVLSDDEVLQKIQTWGHSHQFNGKKWFQHKWLAWRPNTRYIGHITRANYLRAVPFRGKLPEELADFPDKAQARTELTMFEAVDCFVRDCSSLIKVLLADLKSILVRFKIRFR